MWDFYSEYLSSNFSDCLAAMQERGTCQSCKLPLGKEGERLESVGNSDL